MADDFISPEKAAAKYGSSFARCLACGRQHIGAERDRVTCLEREVLRLRAQVTADAIVHSRALEEHEATLRRTRAELACARYAADHVGRG